MRILLVEDNAELSDLIQQRFAAIRIAVDRVDRAGDAEQLLSGSHYAAMILDLGLPDEDGLALLRRLRLRRNAIPILVLTARGSVEDRVTGLQEGADDYLVKPFAFDELAARVEALLRRPGQLLGARLQAGNISLDTRAHAVEVDGRPLALTRREYELLELLIRRSGKVIHKGHVEDQLFGAAELPGSNAVEVYVHRLRRQLERAGASVEIHTIRGIGYMLRALGPA